MILTPTPQTESRIVPTTSQSLPLIAILRGVTPSTILGVADLLIEAGFSSIEIPLNSPDAIDSIKLLVDSYDTSRYKIGAGTVTSMDQLKAVLDTGANLIVTPNCNPAVITAAVDANCYVYPGIATPSEAFNAIDAGASTLKLFPAESVGVKGMVAIKSVLPKYVDLYPVGGIDATIASMAPFLEKGAAGFGLGSALYKPEYSAEHIRMKARAFVSTFTSLTAP